MKRDIVYGAVLEYNEADQHIACLATADGATLVGTREDINWLFADMLYSVVPIDKANSSIPLKQIREHVPEIFKRKDAANG